MKLSIKKKVSGDWIDQMTQDFVGKCEGGRVEKIIRPNPLLDRVREQNHLTTTMDTFHGGLHGCPSTVTLSRHEESVI